MFACLDKVKYLAYGITIILGNCTPFFNIYPSQKLIFDSRILNFTFFLNGKIFRFKNKRMS